MKLDAITIDKLSKATFELLIYPVLPDLWILKKIIKNVFYFFRLLILVFINPGMTVIK